MHPSCPRKTEDKCRIRVDGESSTLIGWTPEYDRSGKLLNKDPNIHMGHFSCSVCKMAWTVKKGPDGDVTNVTRQALPELKEEMGE